MDSNNIVEVHNLKKKYTIRYNTIYGGIAKSGSKTVLNNVNFSIKKGEVVGIVGKNGSGKSTLLKILSKIMGADDGTIEINGRVASILELGMGFDNELSGRLNIKLKCGLYGLTEKEIDSHMDEMIDYSELGDQIDAPLRTYSSGMIAKLAFSVLVNVKCDFLIIDEILSVGDAGFNSKCKLSFEKMKKSGKSILIASHNIESLETMCDRVMWLDNGIIKEYGDPQIVCYHYDYDAKNSIDTIMKMASIGDVLSINRAGIMYRDGINVNQNLKKAKELFEKSSNMGHIDSMINLATMELEEGNKDRAIQLYESAASKGDINASILLIQLNEKTNEYELLKSEIEKQAESGNLRACKMIADMLYNGILFNKDQKKAIAWYIKSANAHNSQSQLTLGYCYRDSIGVERDIEQSIKWFEMAADHGNQRAKTELASMYRKGIGVDVDIKKSIYWYEQAAKHGDPNSMMQLGIIYRDGIGVEADVIKSKMWLKQYSDINISNYEALLADIIRQNNCGTNQKDCIEWYERAIDHGNIRSIGSLASCYRDGAFEIPNHSRIIDIYEKNKSRLDQYSMLDLANIYLNGNGVKRDVDEGLNLLEKVAKMGNTRAMLQLLQIRMILDPGYNSVYLQILNELGNPGAKILTKQMNKSSN